MEHIFLEDGVREIMIDNNTQQPIAALTKTTPYPPGVMVPATLKSPPMKAAPDVVHHGAVEKAAPSVFGFIAPASLLYRSVHVEVSNALKNHRKTASRALSSRDCSEVWGRL